MIPNEQWLKDAVENYKKSPKQITCKDLQAYNDLAQAYLEASAEMPLKHDEKPSQNVTLFPPDQMSKESNRLFINYYQKVGYNQAIDDCTLVRMREKAELEKKKKGLKEFILDRTERWDVMDIIIEQLADDIWEYLGGEK